MRDMPVERISDVISHQLYGTIFFNYVAGQAKSVDEQTEAIVDVMFNGILTVEERAARRAAHRAAPPVNPPQAGLSAGSGSSTGQRNDRARRKIVTGVWRGLFCVLVGLRRDCGLRQAQNG